MKKRNIAKILITAFLFTGCNSFNNKTEDIINQSQIIERDERIKELPYDPVSQIEYINKNINNVDKEKSQLYLFTLEDTLISNLNVVGGVINSDEFKAALSFLDDESTLKRDEIAKISNRNIKNEITRIYDMYYTIYKSGDSLVPNINYDKFLELIKDIITLTEYYKIKKSENDNPTLSKGVLKLSPEELLDRINRIENFILNNKDFERNQDFIARYQSWLYLLLTGTTLSPIVDSDGKVLDSYIELAENIQPITIADNTFVEGMYIINKNQNKFTNEVTEELRVLVRQSVFEVKDRMEMK